MRILIVDDESLAISRMQQLLTAFPQVEVVGDARTVSEAISKILRLKPDVVFFDIEIGNETGWQVIESVNQKGFHPKYIVASAYSQHAIAAIRNKVDDYLLKPVDLTELKASLCRINAKRSFNGTKALLTKAETLSKREHEVLAGMINGKSSKEMALELFLSSHTIDTYRRKILRKTGLKNTIELISSASHINKNYLSE